jgi:hypothetical protein
VIPDDELPEACCRAQQYFDLADHVLQRGNAKHATAVAVRLAASHDRERFVDPGI